MNNIDISISIISLWRETIYKTLEWILNQELNNNYEINIILQWTVDLARIEKLNINNIKVNIYNYEYWLWFWYYRNEAIKKANWDILVWIDDDEWVTNNKWIYNITKDIISWKIEVVTAWINLLMWKWYLTDSISYLWYPWWWAVWFKNMWTVYPDNITTHLCSWNFAFSKSVLNKINWFNETLKNWAEDVAFAVDLINNWIKILYNEEATIYHVTRSWIVNFCKWHITRWKSIYEFKKLWLISWWHWHDKIKSVKYILFSKFFTRYVFWIWFMFFLQNLFNLIWYLKVKYNK